MSIRNTVNKVLVQSGKPAPFSLDSAVWLMNFGNWLKEYKPESAPRFDGRKQLFQHLSSEVIRNEAIDYMEFGVFKGESIRLWAAMNQHPGSRFFGFDSFEGLPEDWKTMSRVYEKSTFSTGGNTPQIDDPRVEWVKGWFQESMPGFLRGYTPTGRLVIHIDADLYSSTLYVLTKLDHLLVSGSIIVFDDFGIVTGVFRAWVNYTEQVSHSRFEGGVLRLHGRRAIKALIVSGLLP
jgi:O-methyltransferase